jgi:hypothetical protein
MTACKEFDADFFEKESPFHETDPFHSFRRRVHFPAFSGPVRF